MKNSIVQLIATAFILLLLPLTGYADEKPITIKGIRYKKVSENQVTIVGFDELPYNDFHEIVRHVTIDRQEYTVVNPVHLSNVYSFSRIERLAVPEFAPDLIIPSDLRFMSKLYSLKINAKALGEYKDYRLIAKHLIGDHPVEISFYKKPDWVTIHNGAHFSSDGFTLLFTGVPESFPYFLPEGVKHIAPYAIGPTGSNTRLFIMLPPSIQSISQTQILREGPVKENRKRYIQSVSNSYGAYLVINNCLKEPENLRFDPPIDSVDKDYKIQLAFAIDPYGEAKNMHFRLYKEKRIPIIRDAHMYTAKGKVILNGMSIKLTEYQAVFLTNRSRMEVPSAHQPVTKIILKDTSFLGGYYYWHYKVEPRPADGMRFLGFSILDNSYDPIDTIRTANAFCWGIGSVTVKLHYIAANLYAERFDYKLSDDKKTLTWWKNRPGDKNFDYLNIPHVTRCGECFLNSPSDTGSYTFPSQLTHIGPRAISNIPNLRELIIDHNLTLEKSSLAGCSQLLLIKLLNDKPLPPNAIRDAFYPDPVPANLILLIPKEHEAIWENVKDNLGAPLITLPDSINVVNKRKGEASMRVTWKASVCKQPWQIADCDSIKLPGLAVFKVDFTSLPAYDFDSICTLSNGSSFEFNDTLLATQSLEIIPACHIVKFPVRFSTHANGNLRVNTVADNSTLDSGTLVTRHNKIVLHAAPSIHYRFAKFTVNGQSIFQNDYVKPVLSPIDIVAFFKPVLHAVTLTKRNETQWTILDSASVPVHYSKGMQAFDSLCENQSYTFQPIPPKGRKIDKAYINGKLLTGADTTLVVNGPISLAATTIPKTCFVSIPDPELHGNIILQLAGGTTIAPNSHIPWGERLTIKANINKKYFNLDSICINGIAYKKEKVVIIAESDTISIDLKATPINFVIFIEPDFRYKATVTSPEPIYDEYKDKGLWAVLPDQPVTIALTATPGWTITSMKLLWENLGEESSPGALKECVVKAPLCVEPSAEPDVFTLTLPAKKKAGAVIAYDDNLKEIKASTKLLYGDSITILPQAGQGYELKTLAINGIIIPPRQTKICVTSNIVVTAFFDKLSYTKADTLVLESYNTILRFGGNFQRDTLDFGSTVELSKVTTVASEAFAYNTHITTIILNGNVSTVESRAFFECPRLSRVIVGPNVRYIGAQAFANAGKLEVIDVLQTNPDLLTIDPAIFQKTRGADPLFVFRVPNEALKSFRSHPKWQHVTVVPQTVDWTFILASNDFQLNVDIFDVGYSQQHLAITQGQSVVKIPGGAHVDISSAPIAQQTITRIALGDAATALPCTNRAMNDLTVNVLQYVLNDKRTGIDEDKPIANLVTIAPNPTSSSVTISPTSPTTLQFTLYNTLGTIINRGSVRNATPTTLYLHDAQPGIYILRVESDRAMQTLRIVKR